MNSGTNVAWAALGLKEALTHLEEGFIEPSIKDLACILHRCRKAKDRHHGLRLQAFMSKNHLDDDVSMGNYLVSMLAEIGAMHDAQQVFDKLALRNEWSWCSMIRGYIEGGKPGAALALYQQMQASSSILPTGQTMVALLKACANLKDLERGLEIHDHVTRAGLLERDIFIGSTLIDMYAKCGSLAVAENVFDKIPVRNVVSWNTLITAYANSGEGELALDCLEKMEGECVPPDAYTFLSGLKACGSIGSVSKVHDIHSEIEKRGLLGKDAFLNSSLIDVYAKCGSLIEAEQAFERLEVRSVVSWNTLMAAYTKHEHFEKAIRCLEHMQLEGVVPDEVSLAYGLRACGNTGAVSKGQEIHAEIEKKSALEGNSAIGSALVDMYTKFGMLFKAMQALNRLPYLDGSAWTALIARHVEHGNSKDALMCFEEMQMEGVSPNVITFVYSLKASCSMRAVGRGQEIHAEVERRIILEENMFIGSVLVDMYASCGLLTRAQQVFDKFPAPDVVLWNTLITGYGEHGYGEEALECFEQMQLEGVPANGVTFVGCLKACSAIDSFDVVQRIHAEIERVSLSGTDLVVGTSLVDAYAKCGMLSDAQEVFNKLPVRNAVSWNALSSGYAENGHTEAALNCVEQMQLEGTDPDAFTLVSIMNFLGKIADQDCLLGLHSEVARVGVLEGDAFVGNALIDTYAKCGFLVEARQVFDKLPFVDVISWNVLIAGYAEKGLGEDALKCFEQMQLQGISPNCVSLISSLKASTTAGFLDKGYEMHAHVAKKGYTDRDPIGNAIVDMYAKCGLLTTAQSVFDKLEKPDTVPWNSLIAGYAQIGEVEKVFHVFNRMQREGMPPDSSTFVMVLSSCSRAGLHKESERYFEAMCKYGLVPTLQHHACMVDLLGRAGQPDMANMLAEKLPVRPNLTVRRAVLGACRSMGNVGLAKQAFKDAVDWEENSAPTYGFMS